MNENDLIEWIPKLEAVGMMRLAALLKCTNGIWKVFKFKVGDRVQLAYTPEISKDKASGWLGAKHFLVKGAKATVKERHFFEDGRFIYYLEFDDDSWISNDGKINVLEDKSVYMFDEDNIENISNNKKVSLELTPEQIKSLAESMVNPVRCGGLDYKE